MSYVRAMGDLAAVKDCYQRCSNVYLPGDATAYARCSVACADLATIPAAPAPAPPNANQPDAFPPKPSGTLLIGGAIAIAVLISMRGRRR